MMTLQLTTKWLVREQQLIAAREAKLKDKVKDLQKVCQHRELAEAEYQHMEYGSSLPPIRICLACGLTEDGWHCGHKVLVGKPVGISRDEVYRLRTGLSVCNHHKGPLIRGEVTLSQLIDAEGSLSALGITLEDD